MAIRRNFHFLSEITGEGEVIPYDRDEVRQALLDLEGTVYQLGGRISMAAARQEIGGTYVTVGLALAYESFVPAVKDAEEPTVDAGSLPESEEVADGAVPTS